MFINKKLILILIGIVIGLTYSFSAVKTTPYDYFILLGKQLLQGKYYLEEAPPWLNELVPDPELDRWYVVYPPMPAITSIPFILLGIESQTTISIIIGLINIYLIFLITKRLYSKKIGIYLALAFGLGTNHWFLATEGSAWYFSHICAVFFLCLSILVLNIKQKGNLLVASSKPLHWLFSGLFLGAAYWSRLPSILALPFFIFLIFQNRHKHFINREIIQKLAYFLAACSLFLALNFFYNYLRFGTIWDVAYTLIPGVLDEPWYKKGIFHYSYIPRNALFAISKLPLLYEKFPFIKPSIEGMSLLLTSPFIITTLLLIKNAQKWTLMLSFVSIAMLLLAFSHGGVGFSQFGYRYGLEAILFLLLSLGQIFKNKITEITFILLLIISVIINFWGIYFIRFLQIYAW